MTCAKKVVTAQLEIEGKVFQGDNGCQNPQSVCPRDLGEDYEKCRSVCGQWGHAEIQAIRKAHLAGVDPTGGHMTVYHKRVCENCQDAMRTYEISWEVIDERL